MEGKSPRANRRGGDETKWVIPTKRGKGRREGGKEGREEGVTGEMTTE